MCAAILFGAAACADSAPPPYSVEIFSNDTASVSLTVGVDGPMEVNLRGEGFYMTKDKSFVVTTPARLTVRGIGVATIRAMESSQLLAVVPAGLPQDSIEAATVVGSRITLTRRKGETAVRIAEGRE